ncbi:MAG: NAD-dependent epimerase/dehydratase family protein [Burkholderiales bacterium]|nr:NAD-dependent epimerase/dehydratase family protein [Burkholderiales bacterium]
MKVMLTGASGFVGQGMRAMLGRRETSFVGASRQVGAGLVDVGDMHAGTDWRPALEGCNVVLHLAGRAHQVNASPSQDTEFFRVNVDASIQLARQARAAGVQRMVFVSSVKVHGEASERGRPFCEGDPLLPQGPYARSKAAAEVALADELQSSGVDLVIVRPPLVYGAGVRANFAALVGAVGRGLPLPLGSVDNRRSMVGLKNLCDFLCLCVDHPAAAGQTFLVSDGEDVSTADLVRAIGVAIHRPARVPSVHPQLLAWGAALVGRSKTWHKLSSNLQVDISHARQRLGWLPPHTLADGLSQMLRADETRV